MKVKRALILSPVLLLLLLLQSYFWVPTYQEQTKGNPERRKEFITASIGDASLLNPVLYSDSSSADIVEKVFEGLVDRDRDLSYRGRLAKSWKVYERAYLYVNTRADIPGMEEVSAEGLVQYLQKARENSASYPPQVKASLQAIKSISLQEPKDIEQAYKFKKDTGKNKLKVSISAPARIKFGLKKVEPDFFRNLSHLLGEKYFNSFQPEQFIRVEEDISFKRKKEIASRLLPIQKHNPVLLFHLREDVYFHDGHKLDAQDVKFTYKAIVNPSNLSPRIADFEPVKKVEAIEDLTVEVTYKRLYSTALASWSIGILPKHLLDKEALQQEAKQRGREPEDFTMRDSRFNRNPVGCGPFKFDTWKSGEYIQLQGFASYWDGPPNYKRFIYRVIPDRLTQEMEFYAGTLDNYSVQPHQVKRLKHDPRYQSFSGTSFGYSYIGYNMRRSPFDERKVRRALSLAINKEDIIEYVLYGQGERITGPFVKQTEYYNDKVEADKYDPDKALELLQEAGWERGEDGWLQKNGKRLEFTLLTNTGNEIRKSVLAIVQDNWKDIGVDVSTDTLEWSVFIQEKVNKFDFDAVVLGWNMSIEPDLYQIWHSSQTDPKELNFVGFKNETADEYIEKIRREYDKKRQVEFCHRLHEIIARQKPYTFLFVRKWTAVLDKRIVIKDRDSNGNVVYRKIKPTRTGDYKFYFNKWVKLPEAPEFNTGN